MLGKNEKTGAVGLVPRNFLEKEGTSTLQRSQVASERRQSLGRPLRTQSTVADSLGGAPGKEGKPDEVLVACT